MIFTSPDARERAKEHFILLTAGFTAAAILGAVVALAMPEMSLRIFRDIGRSIANKVRADSPLHTFASIYINNLSVATSAYALGIIFGIVPWIVILTNGFILGLVLAIVISNDFLSPTQAVLAILPHGILEIPAIILSATAGIMLYRGTLKKEGRDVVYSSLRVYALSAVMLLFAAFVEAYVTPAVAGV
ncbi:hypothetical protein A3L09_07705 [Thermococcus profundus]|uniref:Stage II sporulation protein M n=1 Tax=Thermococcus profundus TaxID=49899 RepID=A0A2Z2MER2_THEPR|nr:stage II sporulation protein M [Thermococcus profundus]ASJ03145.1 hypothetical protein A3L09_07705 [Thermococcus profundus]